MTDADCRQKLPSEPLYLVLIFYRTQIGNPCKPFKSILVGEDAHILRRFVHVLSYFLRCKVSEKRKV